MKDFRTRCNLVVLLLLLATLMGCGALNANQPSAQSANGLVATSSTLDFGTVEVGTSVARTNVVVNNSKSILVLTKAQIDKTDFRITNQKLPLRLAPGEHTSVQVVYSPSNGGSSQAKVVLASNVTHLSTSFSLRGTAIGSGQLGMNPRTITFGTVQVGKTQTQSAILYNSGTGMVTVTQASVSTPGFALTGLNLPLTLNGGQKVPIGVTFTPAANGASRGTIALTGTAAAGTSKKPKGGTLTTVAANVVSTSLKVSVSGTGTTVVAPTGQLAVSPAVLALGSVKLGTSQTQSATLTNSGGSSVTVSQANVTGRGFRLSGLTFPMKLSPGQRKNFSVTFTPQSTGTATGSIAVTSDAPNPVVSVPVSAVVVGNGALTSNPPSLSFGNVQAGSPKTLSATLINSGGADIALSQSSVSGAGFKISGLNVPGTLSAGQSATFSVTFTPQSGGAASGSLVVASDASNGTLTVPFTANTTSAGALSTSDSSLDFGSVQVNGSGTQPETLTNTGGSSVTISQANVSGAGFTATGLSLPLTLSPGQSFTFGAKFSPTAGGNFSGSISVVSDASNPSLTIALTGTASVSGQLAVSPATLNFGSVGVGQSKSMSGSLTASGSSITVSSANMSTAEYTVSGITFPLTLSAGKSASFTVTFNPQASGTASANASFISNASNQSAQQLLTGIGAAAPQHSVALSWNPSSSNVVGYNVYRGTTTGGPYSKITSMNGDTTFTDSSVQGGQTYFYVTTAVDGAGKESAYSNQTQAAVPTP